MTDFCNEYQDFSAAAQTILKVVIVVSCVSSMIGSVLIILSYYLWEDIRSPLRSLIVFLSIADLLTATGNISGLLNYNVDPTVCVIQSFISTGGSMCSFLWTMAIALYLYLVISKQHKIALKMINVFHVVCWGISLFLVSFAMGFNALGPDEFSVSVGWCWVTASSRIPWPIGWTNRQKELFWKFLVGKGIEVLAYIFTPILYVISKKNLHYDRSQQLLLNTTPRVRATLHETDRKLVLIPMVFLFFRIWGSVRFITSVYCPGFLNIYPIALMQGLGDSAQGWANCLLFCFFTTKIRQKFRVLFKNLCTKGTFSSEEFKNPSVDS